MQSPREEFLFDLALTKPARERAAWLDRECGQDSALRARLGALLAAHEQPHTSLASAMQDLNDTNGVREQSFFRKDVSGSNQSKDNATLKLEFTEAALDESVGQTLGRYKLLEKIGEGGCGVVYVAEQTERVRRRVALKVFKLGMDTKAVVAWWLAWSPDSRRLAVSRASGEITIWDLKAVETQLAELGLQP